MDTILDLDHHERIRWVLEISNLNKRLNEGE
jgi:hypothetical protein